jgi:acyl-coenzyme A synthetase/AMP-(fatty) acid ligase
VLEFGADAVVADCDQICETMGIGEEDVNYGVIAFAHSYGFSNLVTPLLLRGVRLVAAGDSLPRALWSGMAASGATVLPAVPAIFRALGGVARDAGDAGRLRLCISAGAPLLARVAGDFREAHGLKIHSFYGASECGGICYDASERRDLPDGFVGTPVRGVELRWDDEGSGGVRVRSAAVCRGLGGGLRPGDLLEGDGAAGYRIVGRTSEIVNVGGRKVNPAAVEVVVAGHPSVREVAVFGRGDAARVQSLAAVVVGEVAGSELRRWCAERLASWQVPREIFVVAAIPVTARGKVSRRELADWTEGRRAW